MNQISEITTPQPPSIEEYADVENVADFLETAGIRMHVLQIHENPHRIAQEQNTAFHYSCKLINDDDKWFVVYFSKGLGLRTWIQPPENFVPTGCPLHVPLYKIGTQYDGPMPPWDEDTPRKNIETFEHCSKPTPPSLEEVVTCLAVDCRTVEDTQGNFSKWCKLFKTSDDSRHAKMTWEIVVKQRAQLLALLGEEGSYHRLIFETELPALKQNTEEMS